MYLPILCCLLVLSSGQNFYRADLRIQDGGSDFPDSSIVVDFGKTDKGFIDNWPFMVIRITSNETMLYKNDDDYFNNYSECREGTCVVLDEELTEYPASWFAGAFKANRILPTLSIGGGAWQMKSSTLWVHKDVKPQKNTNNPYGYIGLGVGGEALNNFQTQYPVFSLRLFNDTQRGEIIFGKDLSRLDSKRPPLVFTTNLNWETQATSLKLGDFTFAPQKPPTFFFDLSFEYINIPEDFKDILKQFAEKSEMTEEVGLYFYAGNITTLPNFEITLADGKILSIPSSIYMQKHPNMHTDQYCLRIIALLDKVVLGQSVISQYYIVFEAENLAAPTISVYNLADPNVDPTPDNKNGLSPKWIIVGVVLLLVASSLAFWLGKKSQAKQLDDYLNQKHNEKSSLIA